MYHEYKVGSRNYIVRYYTVRYIHWTTYSVLSTSRCWRDCTVWTMSQSL